MMEANLTASLMEMQWQNTMGNYCTANPTLCNTITSFLFENNLFIGAPSNTFDDPRWYQVS